MVVMERIVAVRVMAVVAVVVLLLMLVYDAGFGVGGCNGDSGVDCGHGGGPSKGTS